MDGKNPFNAPDKESTAEPDEPVDSVEPQQDLENREIPAVPSSFWTVAGYVLLIALLCFAGYSLLEQRKAGDAMLDELENRRAIIEQAEARALQAETRIITLNTDVKKLEGEVGGLRAEAKNLQQTRQSLEKEKQELIKSRDEAAKIQQSLKDEMLAALESRDVTISELQGNLTLNILDRILFDSGQAIIKPEGQSVLKEIGELLDQVPNRQIHVLGHTDNVPIRTANYPSNWELSAARALAAVRFLVDDGGVDPMRIAAVAHGEFQPIASNSNTEGRARNRRITIVVLPEVFKTPETPLVEEPPATEVAENIVVDVETPTEVEIDTSSPAEESEPSETKGDENFEAESTENAPPTP